MAVYTRLSQEELSTLLSQYPIDPLTSFSEINAGVENSNYLIHTANNRYILTIYEKRVDVKDLPFYLTLMQHLHDHGYPCPKPIATHQKNLSTTIRDKSCALTSFLTGKSTRYLQNTHLTALGSSIAQMHLMTQDFRMTLPNRFSLTSWLPLFDKVKANADSVKAGLAAEIEEHLTFLTQHWPTSLPTGTIHGDLFPDNVFFEQGNLTGVIDFYFACTDYLMYDIAICLNAWCFEEGGDFNITKAKLLLTHYHKKRPISEAELCALPILASGAALRFLLTRLHDWLYPQTDALVTPKDPLEYLKKLRFHHNITSHHEYGL